MSNKQLIIGAAAGLAVAFTLVTMLTGEDTAPAPEANTVVPPGEGEPGTTTPAPSPGKNAALARMQAAGAVSAKPRDPHRSKLMEGTDGFAAAAPTLSGPPPIAPRGDGPAPAVGDVVKPGRPWPLDRDGIRGAVQEALPDLRECYEAWAKLNPTFGARVTVTFTIEPEEGKEGGKIVSAQLANQGMGHVAMEGCIVQVFEDLRFDRPKDGPIKVTYPVEFSTGERDAGQ